MSRIGGVYQTECSEPSCRANTRIKELAARVTEKANERAALTQSWLLEKLRENAEKAPEEPHGSSMADLTLKGAGHDGSILSVIEH